MVGLNSDPLTNSSYESIDYAIYIRSNGVMGIYENGANINDFGAYTTSTVFEIIYSGTSVKYYKDAVLVREAVTIIGKTLYVDSSFADINSKINNLEFGSVPTAAEGGSIVAVRYTHGTMGNRVGYSGTDGTFMDGMEITMPPAKSSSSRYEVYAYSSFDNSPEDTAGGGLAIWAERPDGNSYWVHKSGSHSNYWSGSADLYMRIETHHITDGTEWSGYSGGINKGDQIKFRIYAQTHSGTNHWNVQDISSQYGPGSLFIIKEIDGGVF
jgi:hypothetical protein